jgi:uncharacterized protein (TIGR03435 family)
VIKRMFAVVAVLGLIAGVALGQATAGAAPTPKFEAADVSVAPYRVQAFSNGGALRGDRYVWHQSTLLDLIAAAYGVDADLVQGGPSWLERDRFEIVAKTDPKTSAATLKLMLRSLLADRFELKLHQGEKSMPTYFLTVGKAGKPKLKEASSESDEGCDPEPPPPASPGTVLPFGIKCHDMTMDTLATTLRDFAFDYMDKPVINKTGLDGAWDFELKWMPKSLLQQAGADAISIFDAVDKQLGLKLELQTSPQKVWLVDSADRKPTPNAADIAKILPPAPPPVFEVAIVKPSAPDERGNFRINGGQVNLQALPLKVMVTFAWELNPNSTDNIVNPPKWFNDSKFDIIAKAAAPDGPAQNGRQDPGIDIEDLRGMLQALVAERFNMQYHMEDRPIPAYTLYAANPKMRKADPASRTKCYEGPGPDGKDPRVANPILGRLLTCQNMSMAEIADELQRVAGGYIYGPVLDKTGLTDRYDFTLSFSSAGQLNSSTQHTGSDDASDPSGGMSLYDAVSKQLGLKLVKEKRPMPVLVIDHINDKPTEN